MFNKIKADQLDDDIVVLCTSNRLAVALQARHGKHLGVRGLGNSDPLLNATTVPQWLNGVIEDAQTCGHFQSGERKPKTLSPIQTRILWEKALQGAGGNEEALFDVEGLASVAAEAHSLVRTWQIGLPEGSYSEETQRFQEWQTKFMETCQVLDVQDEASFRVCAVDQIAAGIGALPARVAFAGQDRMNPQDYRLAEALAARGVKVCLYDFGQADAGNAVSVGLPDREAECRAAAAWAAAFIRTHPQGKIGIVVPDLGPVRESLSSILDDALHPESARPSLAQMPRLYNFSLGLSLARLPLVRTALQLLYLASNPHRVNQSDFSHLLLSPFWSADVEEGNGRAQLDVLIRKYLPPTTSMVHLLRFTLKFSTSGVPVKQLGSDLAAFMEVGSSCTSRQLPSEWVELIEKLLSAAKWPGERKLSFNEQQAISAFLAALKTLPDLDGVLGRISLSDAILRLSQVCRDTIHQPPTSGQTRVEVMGMLESTGEPLEALWVMGMNDHLWPSSARPNPLLPADLQRKAKSPNACAEVQLEFALAIQSRLLHSAKEVIFSWAQGEAGRELRPSPLITSLPKQSFPATQPVVGLEIDTTAIEEIEDLQARPVEDGEKVTGGASLLQAQAICPAWAFYRYRLGARALPTPREGIDASLRGTLLHLAMQNFWNGRGQAELLAMSMEERKTEIKAAVDLAIDNVCKEAPEPLPKQLLALERDRLLNLIGEWVHLESQRRISFRVAECEKEVVVDVEGITIRMQVDRIDELEDGQHIVLDYKTGSRASRASWVDDRIKDPQLPMYAALVPSLDADGIAYARVRPGEAEFVGVTADGGILPGVSGILDDRRQFAEDAFPTWPSLIEHWRNQFSAVAREIKQGHAAVIFTTENDLDLYYCDVKPLLRLPEYRAQRAKVAADGTT